MDHQTQLLCCLLQEGSPEGTIPTVSFVSALKFRERGANPGEEKLRFCLLSLFVISCLTDVLSVKTQLIRLSAAKPFHFAAQKENWGGKIDHVCLLLLIPR